jgi:hypothetical protein
MATHIDTCIFIKVWEYRTKVLRLLEQKGYSWASGIPLCSEQSFSSKIRFFYLDPSDKKVYRDTGNWHKDHPELGFFTCEEYMIKNLPKKDENINNKVIKAINGVLSLANLQNEG